MAIGRSDSRLATSHDRGGLAPSEQNPDWEEASRTHADAKFQKIEGSMETLKGEQSVSRQKAHNMFRDIRTDRPKWLDPQFPRGNLIHAETALASAALQALVSP